MKGKSNFEYVEKKIEILIFTHVNFRVFPFPHDNCTILILANFSNFVRIRGN